MLSHRRSSDESSILNDIRRGRSQPNSLSRIILLVVIAERLTRYTASDTTQIQLHTVPLSLTALEVPTGPPLSVPAGAKNGNSSTTATDQARHNLLDLQR